MGGVILTNGGQGWILTTAFLRRVLEILYDGEPQAEDDVHALVELHRSQVAATRRRLTIPAPESAASALAAAYTKAGVGEIAVRRDGPRTVFRFGDWESSVGARRNEDGTVSFVTVDPGSGDFDFVAGEMNGKRTLTLRFPQREHVFVER